MTRWEYDSTSPHRVVQLIDILDGKGKQGWELVTLIEVIVSKQRRFIGIMKRPIEKKS